MFANCGHMIAWKNKLYKLCIHTLIIVHLNRRYLTEIDYWSCVYEN